MDCSPPTRVITTRLDRASTLVTMCGEFDEHTSRELAAATRELSSATAHSVLIDSRDVTFASSALLRELLVLRQAVVGNGGRITVIASSTVLWRILELAQLTSLFLDPSPG